MKTEAVVPGLTESFRISLAASALVALLMLGATVATMLDERSALKPQLNAPANDGTRDQDALSHASAVTIAKTGTSPIASNHLERTAAKESAQRSGMVGPSTEEWRQGTARTYGRPPRGSSLQFSNDCHVSRWFEEAHSTANHQVPPTGALMQLASLDPEVNRL